jgi:hypothetical protein
MLAVSRTCFNSTQASVEEGNSLCCACNTFVGRRNFYCSSPMLYFAIEYMFLIQPSLPAIQNHCNVHTALDDAHNKSGHTEVRKHSQTQIDDSQELKAHSSRSNIYLYVQQSLVQPERKIL